MHQLELKKGYKSIWWKTAVGALEPVFWKMTDQSEPASVLLKPQTKVNSKSEIEFLYTRWLKVRLAGQQQYLNNDYNQRGQVFVLFLGRVGLQKKAVCRVCKTWPSNVIFSHVKIFNVKVQTKNDIKAERHFSCHCKQ